jgi:TPR repeat protein
MSGRLPAGALRRATMLTSVFFLLLMLNACSNERVNPTDPYTDGLQAYDRGDHLTARGNWEALAKAGDCDAEARYALVLFDDSTTPLGNPNDQAEALQLFQVAADRGQPLAELELGLIYATGVTYGGRNPAVRCTGCNLDLVQAYKWLLLAQRHAVDTSQRDTAGFYLSGLKKQLNARQLEQATTLAGAWQPQLPPCAPRAPT